MHTCFEYFIVDNPHESSKFNIKNFDTSNGKKLCYF